MTAGCNPHRMDNPGTAFEVIEAQPLPWPGRVDHERTSCIFLQLTISSRFDHLARLIGDKEVPRVPEDPSGITLVHWPRRQIEKGILPV